jgi:hypothetical protein
LDLPVMRNTASILLDNEITSRIFHISLSLLRRWLVNKLTLAVALAALTALSACKKTGEGQYEVQKPVIGTESDTVNTPSVETGTVKDTITVPTVGTEKKEVNLPKVEVNEPKE